jgi:hypothetical protein
MQEPLAYPCGDKIPEIAEGGYSRLCSREKGDWEGHDDAVLKTLADGMRDSPEKARARAARNKVSPTTTVPSGYVYFGQLIDHDVTKDNRLLRDATPCVKDIQNFRTASLDLDCIYGKEPDKLPCIYETDTERLKLEPTIEASGTGGPPIPTSLNDLPRLPDGRAVIVDPRNDENLVIAQMQVLFAKFHNCALELIRTSPELAPTPEKNLRDKARRFVTWHYQWWVINDFLPNIVRTAVLDDIEKPNSRPHLFERWYTPEDAPVLMPVEFSAAAFRFGHSMVRNNYHLNQHLSVDAFDILRMTYRGGGITSHLPENYVVDWSRFFGSRPTDNQAEMIDTTISDVLYKVPQQTADSFRFQASFTSSSRLVNGGGPMVPVLPEMTLKRGSSMRLPCGEEFATRFKYQPIDPALLFPDQENFFESDLSGRTPLWYYVLREAEIEPNPEPQLGAPISAQLQKLGTVGSRIVAETLYQLLKADAESIVNRGRKWTPPQFRFGPTNQLWCLTELTDLVRFIQSVETR